MIRHDIYLLQFGFHLVILYKTKKKTAIYKRRNNIQKYTKT